MTVYWSDFSWEAFATILTGIAAVGGAIWVGSKQVKLLDQQRIQTDTNLRIQLLERRGACISQMREVVNEWHREASLSPETWIKFRDAFLEAQLLFSTALVSEMDAALNGLFWGKRWYDRAMDFHRRGKQAEADEKLSKSFAEDDKVFKIMPSLLEKLVAESKVSDWF